MSRLSAIVAERRVIVCVGAGGVGKTTVAAAIALQAAAQGRKVVVLTIDPARRLANSLGLKELGNVESRVPDERLRAAGLEPKGELWAMMLDLKRTWDDLILRHAPPDRREAILSSRFYQQLSSALAGSQEYVAMEKLVDLAKHRDFDLLVLDTPPTAHALDFLDAPNRVLDFFGDEKVRRLLAPALAAGRVGFKVFNLTGGYLVKTLARLTGMELMRDLAEFLSTLAPMYDVFKERALEVKQVLADPGSAFVLVSSANPLTVDEALYFHGLLVQDEMPVGAVVANRVNRAEVRLEQLAPSELEELDRLLAGAAPPPGGAPRLQRIAQALSDAQTLADLDAVQVRRLEEGCAPTPVVRVPRLEGEVYDLEALARLDRHLFG